MSKWLKLVFVKARVLIRANMFKSVAVMEWGKPVRGRD